jgi:branched-chain amino acid transport system substrate-binding protein
MKQYLPNADLNNSSYAAGYHYASLLMKVLTACKDDFSRDNIMRQAASLREVPLPLLLPGITVSTSADDYLPFQQLRLRRFNGKSWVGFGDILDDRQD